jgi:hypothetical protein
MGRYYNGDINGKFMFAVQSSNAAERFGVCESEPNYVHYYADEDNLEEIDQELETIKGDFEKVSKFFEDKDYYNDNQLKEAGISPEELSNYADYVLGKKISDCIKENGSCEFKAEL